MKDYIEQFYNEGLATIFYLKPINFIKHKLKNKVMVKLVSFLVKLFYTVLVLIFAGFIFYSKWPL